MLRWSDTASDIDGLVDIDPDLGNPLMRLAGPSEEFRRIPGRVVDVVAVEPHRDSVAQSSGFLEVLS